LGLGGGFNNYSFGGEISEIAIFSSPLTDTMMQTLLADMQTANRIRADANTNQVVFIGDSLTAGGPGTVQMSHCYPWVLCQQYGGAFKPLLIAAPGCTIAQQQTLATNVVQTTDLTPFGVNVAIICCGSNDLVGGRTTAQVQNDLATLCSGLRAAGFKVILTTITLRTNGIGSTNAGINANFNTVNAALRASYTNYADALVDWAADSRLADPTNTTYFADDIHTTPAGDAVKAALVKAALDPILTPPSNSQAALSFGGFYSAGRNFTGSFGNFVRS
jgi:lysophospholipase L1-like esterase